LSWLIAGKLSQVGLHITKHCMMARANVI